MGQGGAETWVLGEIDDRAAGPEPGVGRSPDHERQTRLPAGGGAHRARLERDVEGTGFEPPVVETASGGGERQELGVRGRIRELRAPVAGARDDLTAAGHDRADRNLVPDGGGFRLAQGRGHEAAVGVVEYPFRQHGGRIPKGPALRAPWWQVERSVTGYLISTRSLTPSGAQARVMIAVE